MMGRSPCCDENGLKKGPWTPEEDQKLIDYIQKHGHGSWRALPKLAGLNRCGKSCRLRWTNYLRPDIKRGKFTEEEERIIIHLHSVLGNKWSAIATNLQGRTDNEIKNYWNTHLKKKLLQKGIDPITHRPRTDLSFFANLPQLLTTANLCNLMNPWENALKLQADAAQLAKIQLFNLLQVINSSAPVNMEAFSHLGSTPFQDHHLIAYLQSISQLEGVVNNPLGLVPDPIQMPSSFSNVRLPQPLNDCQTMTDSCVGSQEGLRSNVFNNDNNIICNNNSNRFAIPTVNPIPSSVSALPESSTADQMERKIIPANISAPSATSTTFEAWGELNLDHEASSDYYWTDLSYSID